MIDFLNEEMDGLNVGIYGQSRDSLVLAMIIWACYQTAQWP